MLVISPLPLSTYMSLHTVVVVVKLGGLIVVQKWLLMVCCLLRQYHM